MFTNERSRDDVGFNLNPTNPNPSTVQGDPGTLEGVAHTQTVDVESDLTRGDVAGPMVDARTHLEGTGTEILTDTDDNWLAEDGLSKRTEAPMSSCKSLGSAASLRQRK